MTIDTRTVAVTTRCTDAREVTQTIESGRATAALALGVPPSRVERRGGSTNTTHPGDNPPETCLFVAVTTWGVADAPKPKET